MRVAVVGARQRSASSGGTRGKLLDAVSGRGLRLTRQRRAVLEVMERSKSHLDAATILERARALDPTVHKVTVYRTLETLKKHGLVDELDLMHVSGERHYYEIRPSVFHIHLVCMRCGSVDEPSGAESRRRTPWPQRRRLRPRSLRLIREWPRS